jgi:hypothetical protein
MLSPQDIRYGNYILGKGKRIKVIGLLEGVTGDDHNYYSLEDCDGIELDGDLLDEVGFLCTTKGFFYRSDFPNSLKRYSAHWLVKSSPSADTFTSLKHFHQLQNLYYDATGGELNFNQ